MGDQSLIYSFVARGTTVLSDYSAYSGNFSAIALQCLTKLSHDRQRHTYVFDQHTFNFLVEDRFTFLAVADADFDRVLTFAFLDSVKDDFRHLYQDGRADLAVANSLNDEFRPKLKEHWESVVVHSDEIKKVFKIKSQIAEVQGAMIVNIEQLLDRNEKIDLHVGKENNLNSNAHHFQKQGNRIRRRACCAHFRLKLVVMVLVIIVVFVIYLSICRGFICHNPGVPGTIPAGGPPVR